MPLRRITLSLLLLLLPAVTAPAGAQTALDVNSEDVLARDVAGDIDGIVEPGDTVELIQRLRNTGSATLAGLSGRLTSPDATVTSGFSPYPDVIAGGLTANTATPYRLTVPSTLQCGTKADLTFSLRNGAGANQIVSQPLVTGVPGVPQEWNSVDDVTIPANGDDVTSTITVPAGTMGYTSAVRVRIDRLTHPTVRDLRLELVSPRNVAVELLPAAPGTPGTAFDGTLLVADGPSLGTGSSPWTGTFGATELGELGGQPLAGAWTIRARTTVTSGTATGALDGWTLELLPASCVPVLSARITRTPRVGVPGQTVTLSGATSVTPTATPAPTYRWDIGADGSFEHATVEAPVTHPGPMSGLVPVRLEIEQGGVTDTEELLVPFSNPPVARLVDPPNELTGAPITFDASGSSDPDGDSIVEFRWDADGDGVYERNTNATPTYEHTYATPGNKTMGVQVVDGFGAVSETSVGVVAINRAPTAALAGPAWAVAGEAFTLDASASSDADGVITHFLWDLDGDGACDDLTTTTASTSLTLTAARTLRVCARDDLGSESVAAVRTVNVTRRPVAAISAPATVKPGAAAALSAVASSDPDGDLIAAYAWDLDGDGGFETPGITAAKTWTTEGPRTVRLRVTDVHGITGSAERTVTVLNLPPAAALVLTPSSAPVGSPVAFDARGSTDADGAVVAYAFDLDGDGSYETPSATGVAARTYPYAGALSVGVRVTDSDGKSATARRDLLITSVAIGPGGAAGGGGPAPLAPARASPPSGGGAPGDGADAHRALAASLTGVAIQRRRSVLRSGLVLHCRADRAVTCRLTATVAKAAAKRLGLARRPQRDVIVGRATARNGALRLRLNRRAAARVGRARSVLVLVRGTATDARGRTRRIVRSVLVRR